jgi:hypothetical protein
LSMTTDFTSNFVDNFLRKFGRGAHAAENFAPQIQQPQQQQQPQQFGPALGHQQVSPAGMQMFGGALQNFMQQRQQQQQPQMQQQPQQGQWGDMAGILGGLQQQQQPQFGEQLQTMGQPQQSQTFSQQQPQVPQNRQQVVGQVQNVANQYGWGQGEQWNALQGLIMRESGFNPQAANPTSSARGLFQKLTSMHGAIEPTVAGQTQWGLNYIKGRYGTPQNALAFWEATKQRNPNIAAPQHRGMAQTWIQKGYVGY